MTSLYDKLGGAPAVEAAVDIFYGKVLADARIKHFFSSTDMARQRQHQKSFLTFAFGGPNAYHGRNMRAAHQQLVDKLGLDDSHFDAVVENLAATLGALGVPQALIAEVGQVAASVRDDVLGR
ncbi:group 1 truncated hemoglobin [Azoarcus sp. DD4]|uniref:group I truncated hemoglobin n=1 Tax=Azoarcus sp. DD4 TaxID=2027405 RepID=UPI001129F9A4|nr:group 1 truncated hemoglobin [Azoarcus sp. DD4]QDF96693.1 group 1 truncated hemoglobin [Azoarcus sp. DD4]